MRQITHTHILMLRTHTPAHQELLGFLRWYAGEKNFDSYYR